MFICVTHVDYKTKIPGFKKPMRSGPAFPEVKGFVLDWADQSNWPLTHPDQYPRFYGTCDDDADTTIPGVIEVLSEERYNTLKEAEMTARLPSVATATNFRLALLKKDLLGNVVSYLDTLEEPLKTAMKIDFEFSIEIFKYSSFVNNIKTNLNWDDNTVTDIFVTASQIDTSSFDTNNSGE